jgi:hypothetical protein
MFKYLGKNKKVSMAANYANNIVFNNLFYIEINGCKFHNSTASSVEISNMYRRHMSDKIDIKIYKKWWKIFSSEVAYFSKKTPNTINLNYYYIKNRSVYSVVGSICHEACHLVDNKEVKFRFSHSKHNHSLRKNTAPYKIGEIAKNMATRLFS